MCIIGYSTELKKAVDAFAESNNDAIIGRWAGQRKIRWTACSAWMVEFDEGRLVGLCAGVKTPIGGRWTLE